MRKLTMGLVRHQRRTLLVLLLGLACAEYRFHVELDAGGAADVDAGVDAGPPPIVVDAGDESDFTDQVCADVGRPVRLVPLDLLVLLDVSGSMDYDLKWIAVKAALESFVTRTDLVGLGVGLQYFPKRAQCRVDAYETPTVPIGPLVERSAALVASLDAQRMSGGTPTVPALQGTMAYVKAHLAAHAGEDGGRRAAVVLATDGMPDTSCAGLDLADAGMLSNNVANVTAVARAAAASDPPVKTFVIGVGRELGALHNVADAGGTSRAVLVDVTGNAADQFLAALTQIRRDALGCDFALPMPGTVDLSKVRVRFEPDGTGVAVRVPHRADATACGTGQGWYFDVPGTPSRVVLCDATCNSITSGTTGLFRVEFACGVN